MLHRTEPVAITGIGIVSPLGHSYEHFGEALYGGRCGIGPISSFDASKYKAKTAGEIRGFSIGAFSDDEKLLRMPLYLQYAIAASIGAIKESRLDFVANQRSAEKTGIFFGTTSGPLALIKRVVDSLLDKGPMAVEPFLFQETVFNAPASYISIINKIRGPVYAFPMSFNAGLCALECACRQLCNARIDHAIIGTCNEYTELLHRSFLALNVLSPRNSGSERFCPYDKKRNGYTMAEGACFLTAELLDRAVARGTAIHGIIRSIASAQDTCGAGKSDPSGKGAALAMRKCLDASKCSFNDIDFLVSMATSSGEDTIEEKAVHAVFKERSVELPVVSILSYSGLMMDMGLPNIIGSLLCLEKGVLPPLFDSGERDLSCSLNLTSTFLKGSWKRALVNSYGWGGHYTSVIIEKAG
jgi:3-oxoacyl-[acyl-carrier-protein] synthase II